MYNLIVKLVVFVGLLNLTSCKDDSSSWKIHDTKITIVDLFVASAKTTSNEDSYFTMKKDELQRRLFEKLDSLNDSNIYSVVEKEALEVNGKKIDYEILVLYQKENAHYTLVFSDKNPNGYTEFETRNLAIFYKGCNRKVMPFCIEMKDEKKIYRYNYRFLLFNEEEGILFSEFIDDCENNDSENYERYCSNKMVMEMVEDLVHIFKYPDRNR